MAAVAAAAVAAPAVAAAAVAAAAVALAAVGDGEGSRGRQFGVDQGQTTRQKGVAK